MLLILLNKALKSDLIIYLLCTWFWIQMYITCTVTLQTYCEFIENYYSSILFCLLLIAQIK